MYVQSNKRNPSIIDATPKLFALMILLKHICESKNSYKNQFQSNKSFEKRQLKNMSRKMAKQSLQQHKLSIGCVNRGYTIYIHTYVFFF